MYSKWKKKQNTLATSRFLLHCLCLKSISALHYHWPYYKRHPPSGRSFFPSCRLFSHPSLKASHFNHWWQKKIIADVHKRDVWKSQKQTFIHKTSFQQTKYFAYFISSNILLFETYWYTKPITDLSLYVYRSIVLGYTEMIFSDIPTSRRRYHRPPTSAISWYKRHFSYKIFNMSNVVFCCQCPIGYSGR